MDSLEAAVVGELAFDDAALLAFHTTVTEAADHDRSKARTGRTERFLTSTKALDEVALTLDFTLVDTALESREIGAAGCGQASPIARCDLAEKRCETPDR